ncbi:MAG: winged helix-turn-helix domain-containing protein [Allosphingosinicella sp.]
MNYFADEFRRRIEGRRGRGGSQTPALARRPDFRLGAATIHPSVRSISGPTGSTTAEPRVMQVLLALADANGTVLTRDDLIDSCWNGQVVGDDSINRAIAEIRRIARETSAGFVVETIPRIGYRLTGSVHDEVVAANDDSPSRAPPNRRTVIAGALVAAAAAGVGGWYVSRPKTNPQMAALIERGRQALRDELPDSNAQGIGFLRQATALDSENAEAWGLLAMALRNAVEHSPAIETAIDVRDCEAAARRALAIDPREGNALTALATIRPIFGDWGPAEGRLRRVLELVPDQLAAISNMGILFQSSGYETESGRWLEEAVRRDPLSPAFQFRLAWKLWTMGRNSESDRVIDRALQLFPLHPAVWNARMVLFALTGRPRAALAMIDDEASRPPTLNAGSILNWQLALAALESRSTADIEAAKRSQFLAVTRAPFAAVNATMIFSVLGEIDAAFEVANGYLLRRGNLITPLRPAGRDMVVNDQRWKKTQMLFTPAVSAMQADPRFIALCEGIGLGAYWRARNRQPDFMTRR